MSGYDPFLRMSKAILGGGLSGVMNSAEFILPLNDLGAGAVDTTLMRGTGSATFTRATAAWTKLSTGLWASVASGTARSSYIGLTTAVGAYGGYFAEGAGIQLVTPTASIRNMTNAAWTKGATITVAQDGTGIDGAGNSCTRVTGGAVAGTNTVLQALVAAASSRTYSCWMRRVTGTGTVNITQDGGSTWTDVTSQLTTANFVLVQLNASVLNASFGVQVVTNGDVILVDFNQFEAGAFATSPMAAAGAVRNADVLTYAGAGNILAAAGSCYAEATTFLPTATNGSMITSTNNGAVQQLWKANGQASTTISVRDATGNFPTKTALTDLGTGVRKRASSWGSGLAVTGDGATPATAASYDGGFGATTICVGNIEAGSAALYGTLKGIRIWQRQLPNATLQAITA